MTAAQGGVVKVVGADPAWKGWVTIEHQNSRGARYTTVYWHLSKVSVKAGQTVKRGQQIGTVADLGGNTHLHFGVRDAAYSNTSNRGGLPVTACTDYPAWPESFKDPKRYLPQ